MKKLILAIITIGCVVVVSCKKEKPRPVTLTGLYITATMNSTAGTSTWVGTPTTGKIPNDSLLIKGVNSSDNSSLAFRMPFRGAITYVINAPDDTLTTTAGGATTVYWLDATQTNTVTIKQYDTTTKVAQGAFVFHFLRHSGSANASNGVNFTNGKFSLKLPF
ncbi:MAG: hypothetical protein ACXVIY_00280 [Mucilaginibacter sp.]